MISEKGLRRSGASAPAAPTRGIRKLAAKPAIATATITSPIFHGSSFHITNRKEPMEVPSTIATNVLISSSALARDRSSSGSISGTIPYLAGLNSVE